MRFALEKTKLWRYIEGMAISPLVFEVKKDNDKDWMEKTYTQQEKIVEFEDNTCKTIAKIRKICINII